MRTSLLTLALLLASGIPSALAGIRAAEYYIGADPGPGAGVAVPRPSPADKATFQIDIPSSVIAALPPGVYWVTGRVQDEAGNWSVAFSRPFTKANPVATPFRGIIAAEYYINSDPGPGQGVRLALPGPVSRAELQFNVPPAAIAALPDGVHWITGRVQNEGGEWSVAFTRAFSKGNPVADQQALAARIEYQWRLSGAAIGAPVILNAQTPAKVISFNFLASLRGLSDGVTYQLTATPFDTAGRQCFSQTTLVKIETTDQDGDGLPDLWELNHDLADASANGDADGDGLSNLQEFLTKTDPRNKDTSGDGLSDGFAVSLGLDPLQSYPQMRASMITHAQELGLANESQIRTLNGGGPVLVRDALTGKFTIRLGLTESPDLVHWSPFPITAEASVVNDGWLEYSFMSTPDTVFYRVSMDE